jgi:hypothetical protein
MISSLSTRKYCAKDTKLLNYSCASIALLFISIVWFFAPWISFGLSILLLHFCSNNCPRLVPVNLLLVSHAGSVIQASRYFFGESSDFVNYYYVFGLICESSTTSKLADGFGSEIGLSAIYYAISQVGGCDIPIHTLAYVQGLIVGFVSLLVFNAYVTKKIPPRFRSIVLMGFAASFSFFYTTQLSRQFIASIIIFYSIFLAENRRRMWIALLLAIAFHITSLLIFPVIYTFANFSRKASLALIALFPIFIILGYSMLGAAIGYLGESFISSKLLYYDGASIGQAIASDYTAVVYLLLISLLWHFGQKSKAEKSFSVFKPVIYLGVIGVILLPFPLLATRFILLYGQIISGALLIYALAINNMTIARTFLVAFVIAKSLAYSGELSDGTQLWVNYPAHGINPGYIFEYLK